MQRGVMFTCVTVAIVGIGLFMRPGPAEIPDAGPASVEWRERARAVDSDIDKWPDAEERAREINRVLRSLLERDGGLRAWSEQHMPVQVHFVTDERVKETTRQQWETQIAEDLQALGFPVTEQLVPRKAAFNVLVRRVEDSGPRTDGGAVIVESYRVQADLIHGPDVLARVSYTDSVVIGLHEGLRQRITDELAAVLVHRVAVGAL